VYRAAAAGKDVRCHETAARATACVGAKDRALAAIRRQRRTFFGGSNRVFEEVQTETVAIRVQSPS
jgi:hypothetical protein